MLLRITYLGAVLTVQLSLLTFCSYLVESGQAPLVFPVILIFWGIGLLLLGFIFRLTINIVQGTAVGQVKMQELSEDFYTSIVSVIQMIVAVGISSMPGGILASILYSMGASSAFFGLLFPLSIFLFFPFVLLSQMEGEHFFHVISLPVAHSIRLVPTAWMRCYGESFILCLITTGLIFVPVLHNLLLRILVGFGLVTTVILFARSVGILGYACNRALLRDSIRREELSMPSPR
jgi:hypothetical protein